MAYVAALAVSVAAWVGAALWLVVAPAPLDGPSKPTAEVSKLDSVQDKVDLEAKLLF